MSLASFQIRVCQTAGCGLRYPLAEPSSFGDRCPICLGRTIAVLEQSLEREPIVEKPSPGTDITLHVLLDNIRSASNVGSIFRSAEGFGFCHAYLCGITATPENSEVRKTALGADRVVPWSAHKNGAELVRQLATRGFDILALERTRHSVAIDSAVARKQVNGTLVLVLGNEVTGVDPGILGLSHQVVHLPMRGNKRSFNVAVAFAVAAQILRSRQYFLNKPSQASNQGS